MRRWMLLTGCLFLTATAQAADLTVSVQIPRIAVAEYHRPFVAIWLEKSAEQKIAKNLAVWYLIDPKKDDASQWLKDLRQWWRRGGREAATPMDGLTGATSLASSASSSRISPPMPIDAVTGATRPVGEHKLVFKVGTVPLGNLTAGKYTLSIEAAREAGGRELLQIPFEWPVVEATRKMAQGKLELGRVTLDIHP